MSTSSSNSRSNKKSKPAKSNKISKIKVFYCNADSLSNKKDELEILIKHKNIDIALICETEPKFSSLPTTPIIIEGYDSVTNKDGRGVMIIYKEHLNVTLLSHINNLFSPSLFIKVSNSKSFINIGITYRSPNNSEFENKKLNDLINDASKSLKNLYIFGDFNFPEVDWDNMNCNKPEEHPASLFLHTIEDCKLDQLVNNYTHIKPNCKPSLIDLIFTNNLDLSNNPSLQPPLGKSHHAVILLNLIFENDSSIHTEKVKKYQTYKGNYSAINCELKDFDWDSELANLSDVDTAWNIISSKVKCLRDKYIPAIYIRTQRKKKPVVINDSILHLTRLKRFYYKKYKKHRSNLNYQYYCVSRARVNKAIRKEKRSKEMTIAKDMKTNPKKFYQYISSKSSKKDTIPDLIMSDGSRTKNDEEKSSTLNDFFSSVFTTENNSTFPEFEERVSEDKYISTASVTEEEMKEYLRNLKPNKSPGTDEIHPYLLRECASTLAKPLSILFNMSIKLGKLPSEWKQAEIRPIYKKKGSKSDPSNYRPVSLTSITCKIFEKVIKKSLCNHLINNNLLSPHQFGFIPGRNTNSQLLVTIKEWQKSLDHSVPTDVAYLDFRKAFDAVPHNRLLLKLNKYGIKGNLLLWIENFLSGRTQYVKINNAKSISREVTSGVPQGSVLGPMLFIYFINDLPEVSNVTTKIYADDTKAYSEIKNEDDRIKLQNSIDALFRWTQDWQLHFNESKCKILHIGENNPKYTYYIGEGTNRREIDTTVVEKDLGVLVDNNLNFEDHIDYIIKRASSKKAQILRNFTYRSKKVLVPLFKSLVRPILEYVNSVWDSSLRSQINLIEAVQRKYTKHILEVRKLSYEERLKILDLPSLEYRRFRGDLIQVYKIVHKHYDRTSVNSLFRFNNSSRLRGHSFKLTKFITKKRQYQHFFTNRIVNKWNSLSQEIVSSETINTFKNNIDREFKDLMYTTNLV